MTTDQGMHPSEPIEGGVEARKSEWPLISALVVSALILLVALIGSWGVTGDPMTNDEVAERKMNIFQGTIEMYYLRNRKMPPSLETLTEEDPKSGEAWLPSIPVDPWGTPYQYTPLGGKAFRILSFGADRQEGTDDDIAWPPPR